MMSWVIAGYETNTNSYDPKNCFCGYTGDPAVVTTTPYGELIVDFAGKKNGREFSLSADVAKGKWKDLNPELWVEGNLSIDYGGELKVESSKPFSLIFDPYLMRKALDMPPGSVEILKNTYLAGIIDGTTPICAALFPYSQHFIIKQDLAENAISNEADLNLRAGEFLQSSGFKTMSGDDIKKPILAGMLISALVNFGIIVFLAIALFLR